MPGKASGLSKGIEYGSGAEALPIVCFRCGLCCTAYRVPLSRQEAELIAQHLRISPDYFLGKYADHVWYSPRGFFLLQENKKCIFLKNDTSRETYCTIHEVRPACCRKWQASFAQRECRQGLTEYWKLNASPSGEITGLQNSCEDYKYFIQSLKTETERRSKVHAITASNLRNAHGGESMAHMRYQIWGKKAEEEGFTNIARLFRAIASAETIHATNHFRELKNEVGDSLCASMAVFGLGSTSQNLQGGIAGETYEITEMYPTYLETARFQNEKGAEQSFFYALSAEKTHAALFKKAKDAADASQKDIALGPVQICLVCGWTHEGEIPEKCPICGAKAEKFQTFA